MFGSHLGTFEDVGYEFDFAFPVRRLASGINTRDHPHAIESAHLSTSSTCPTMSTAPIWAAACQQLPTSCGPITAPAGGHNSPSHVSHAFVVEQHTAGSQWRTICNSSCKAIEPSNIQLKRLFHLNHRVALEGLATVMHFCPNGKARPRHRTESQSYGANKDGHNDPGESSQCKLRDKTES